MRKEMKNPSFNLHHFLALAIEWGGMSGTAPMAGCSSGCRGLLVGTDICFLCCCLCSAKVAPCLFKMHTGEGFQDIIAAVNFWSHETRELLVTYVDNEFDMNDATAMSKADRSSTPTGRGWGVSLGLRERPERWPWM